MNTFWKTIADYNSATWIYQLVIILIGFVITTLMISHPRRWTKMAMKIYFILTYLWISVVYYYIYCDERSYNNVMSVFWGVLAVAWIWDLLAGYTKFERNDKYKIFAYLLIVMPFFYPIFSLLRGLEYPGITSPVMPCSIVTFTIGVLLLFSRKVNIFIILLLCHWSLIGLTKTYFFQIPEDFLLAGVSIPALYLFFKEYYLSDLHKDTKPETKYINWLLIMVCLFTGLLLMGTLFVQIYKDI